MQQRVNLRVYSPYTSKQDITTVAQKRGLHCTILNVGIIFIDVKATEKLVKIGYTERVKSTYKYCEKFVLQYVQLQSIL